MIVSSVNLTILKTPRSILSTFPSSALCDFMEKKGFKVTRHAYGLETAWEAVFEYGKGGRTIGFNSEMDALPGIGHACG